jgi:hypothetical protein
MSFEIGMKVKIRENNICSSVERELVGIVIKYVREWNEVKVEFKLTLEQLRRTGNWPRTRVKDDHCIVQRTYAATQIMIVKTLTNEEQLEFARLKGKTNRSPVEEFILFGLEQEIT